MLGIYADLFGALRDGNIGYCVYKGLAHLAADLDGARGDVDLLVSSRDLARFQEIAQRSGFFCASTQEPYYYVGLDHVTNSFVMLDVCTRIEFGPKPCKPYRLNLDFDALQLDRGLVNTLSPVDYFPLMLCLRVTSASERPEDLKELQGGVATLCGSGAVLGKVQKPLILQRFAGIS